METKKRKYIIEALQNRVARYNFYMRVNQCAVDILKDCLSAKLTKNHAKKILNEIQKAYPEAMLYWNKEKWSTDCQFRYSLLEDCYQSVPVNSMQSDAYTDYLHNLNKDHLKYSIKHYDHAVAQLNNINELIALHEKQETELEELHARQQLERDTFAKQCKCPDVEIASLIKTAQERIDQENYEADWTARNAEIEAKRQATRQN